MSPPTGGFSDIDILQLSRQKDKFEKSISHILQLESSVYSESVIFEN